MSPEPVKIVPAPVVFRHDWKTRPIERIVECNDGNNRTLRICAHCELIKITVHARDGRSAWRAWRLPGHTDEWVVEMTPPCPGPKSHEPAEPTKLVTGEK